MSGRATSVVIDPADPSGNAIYIGGAQSGIWQSTDAANNNPSDATWTPITDDQATLSIGAIAIQPGNADPGKTMILAATGEANNSADSYFGLGILRSTDAGSTWALIPTANSGALSFSGLGGTRMAFSTASGQTNTVVAAMATSSEGLIDGAVTAGTTRGFYTSLDAGQTWTYNALVDLAGATDATSATSVVYNATAGQFFAAVRYHGFYTSPDGVNWTRLANQPGGGLLSVAACPAQSTSNNYACPIYRAEIAVVPGRNEDVRLVYLSVSDWQSGRWRHLAKHERRRVLDFDFRRWHHELRRLRWLRRTTGRLQPGVARDSKCRGNGSLRRGNQSLQVRNHDAKSDLRKPRVHEPHTRLRM